MNYSLVEFNTVKSVLQNIRLILTTPRGSDVHRPEFGSDIWQFLDKPLNVLTAGRIKAEITDAIETWEPRVRVKEVAIERNYPEGKAKIRLILELTETAEEIETSLWL